MNLEHRYHIDNLLEGCKQGQRKVQELLYRSLASKMYQICLRYAHNTSEAEDIMQIGFVKVFKQVNNFRGEGSFEGWIRRVMVNTAIESYRKRCKSLEMQAQPLEEAYVLEQGTFDMNQLEVKDLLQLIQELPDGYRMVFNLYAIEGYSHREIAELLGVTEGASKSQLSRARTWLKNRLIQLEGGSQYGTYGR